MLVAHLPPVATLWALSLRSLAKFGNQPPFASDEVLTLKRASRLADLYM